MIKLKDILSEAYAWERQEGKSLPTLAEVQAAYDAKMQEQSEDDEHEYEDAPEPYNHDDEDEDDYMDEAAKPDFLDLDGDGDETESMKSAANDSNSDVKEKKHAYESFNKRMLGNLHGHEYILREAFKRN